MSREFEIRREVELPATPEEVWEAVATGPGNASWLFPGGEVVEPREGGRTEDGGTVTAWDPPRRFAVRTEGEGGWFNALEFVLEGRGGGTTVLRYVHSGIITEDWDDQYDAVDQHTDFYLHTLGQYLAHFKGRTATFVGGGPEGINGPPAAGEPDALDTLKRALGLGDGAAEGDAVSVGARGLDGVVDYMRPNFLGVRTADGMYRFFGRNAFGGVVGMTAHVFSDGVDPEKAADEWRDWLNSVYV
jgi:uncharacterized protein YndB with AHSA1/START domain